jgi:hypothetical protein
MLGLPAGYAGDRAFFVGAWVNAPINQLGGFNPKLLI